MVSEAPDHAGRREKLANKKVGSGSAPEMAVCSHLEMFVISERRLERSNNKKK
jgi:hypothetical protein